MKIIVIITTLLLSLYTYSAESSYSISGLSNDISIQIFSNQIVLKHVPTEYQVIKLISKREVNLTFSWMNDGSAEVSRIILSRDGSKLELKESYTVYNDGDPMLVQGSIRLLKL